EGNVTHSQPFTVNLSAPVNKDITLHYSTADGSAVAGTDYASVTDSIATIPKGSASGTFSIAVLGNTAFGPDKDFFVNLSQVTNGNLLTPQVNALLVNDDAAALNIVLHGVNFTDAQGDLVTVTSTKGDISKALTFDSATGKTLQMINLSLASFAGTSVKVTAVKQGANGDGLAEIGYISAKNVPLTAVNVQ